MNPNAATALSADAFASRARPLGKLRSTVAACVAFFFAALFCMAAAAAVASHDVPLTLGGL